MARWQTLAGTVGSMALALAASLPAWAADAPATSPAVVPRRGGLDDVPEPFVPARPDSPDEARKLEALSLFAAGRLEQDRENYAAAFDYYRRAFQQDPHSLPILKEWVAVARETRQLAAVAPALLEAAELDASLVELLEELGSELTAAGDFANALKLFERWLALQTDERSADYIRLTMLTGRLYLEAAQPEKASRAFERVMRALDAPKEYRLPLSLRRALAGDDGENYAVFALAFLAADRPEDAIRAFEKQDQVAPNKGLHGYHVALVQEHQKQPEKALRSLEVYFETGETGAGVAPYELLEKLLGQVGRPAELVPRLEKALAQDADNVPLRYFLAGRYVADAAWAKAEPLYEALIEQRPLAEAFAGLADVYRHTGQIEPLMLLLGKAVASAGDLGPLRQQAEAIAADAELVEKLISRARTHKPTDPDDPSDGVHLAIGLLALDAKEFAAANELFEMALSSMPSRPPQRALARAQVLLTWGLGLLIAEQHADAVKVFRRGVDEDLIDENPTFHKYLAMALEMDGQTEAALEVAREAIEIGEHAPDLEIRVPWILYHAKRLPEARAAYEELLAKYSGAPPSEEIRDAVREARLALSNICVLQNDIPAAEKWLEDILAETPDDISALNDLGYLWADQGKNLPRALEMIQKAIAAEPDNTAYIDSLGWVLYRLGRAEEAVVQLRKAAEGDDADGVILDHLADALAATGQIAEARRYWQRAIEAFEQDKEADKAAATRAKLAKHPEPAKPPSPKPPAGAAPPARP